MKMLKKHSHNLHRGIVNVFSLKKANTHRGLTIWGTKQETLTTWGIYIRSIYTPLWGFVVGMNYYINHRKEVIDYMNERKLELLNKIKKAHYAYQKCSEEQKARLDEAMKHVFVELEEYGMPWTVAWSLMVFGNEFYFAEIEKVRTPEAQEVFGQEQSKAKLLVDNIIVNS